jgi:4-amino-4-deoxy-L-arabinose transferase-like glycosyltransferase
MLSWNYFKRNYFVIILILFSISLFLSFINPYSGDGCWHVSVSKYIAKTNVIPFDEALGRIEYFWPPFLFHVLFALVYKLSAFLHIPLDFFVLPLFFLGSLFLTYFISRRLYSHKVALLSIVLLGTLPFFLDYSSNYHIGIMLTFFVLLVVFFSQQKNWFLAGLFYGFSIFTKMNGFFILPIVLYFIYREERKKLKALLIFGFTSLFGLIPYIRNYVVFGNPIWPFMNSVFKGITYGSGTAKNGMNATFDLSVFYKALLEFFGIPRGDLQASLHFVENIVGFNLIYLAYFCLFIFSILLLIILVYGIKDNKHSWLILWIISFFPLIIVYYINIGSISLRFILPAFPAIALFLALGCYRILNRFKRYNTLILFFLIFICCSFVGIVFCKHLLAGIYWNKYSEDFNFLKNTIPEGSHIYYNGQCLTAHTNHFSAALEIENIEITPSYVFLNKNFIIEPSVSTLNKENLLAQTNCTIIYSNNNTGTDICFIE